VGLHHCVGGSVDHLLRLGRRLHALDAPSGAVPPRALLDCGRDCRVRRRRALPAVNYCNNEQVRLGQPNRVPRQSFCFRRKLSIVFGHPAHILHSVASCHCPALCVRAHHLPAVCFCNTLNMYVSCRSRRGRGWAYAPLRFELDESGRASFFRSSMPQMMRQGLNERLVSASASLASPESCAACEDLRSESAAICSCGPLTGLRQRLVRFQKRRELQCQVFVIPCVARYDGGTGGRDADFGLARPAFDMRWLRPLQRLADANTKLYFSIGVGCFGVPSFFFSFFLNGEARGIVCLILNSVCLVMMLGFFSSKQYNLDKAAVKHVALSFRFAIIAALLVFFIILHIRRAYVVANTSNVFEDRTTFWDPPALSVFFCIMLSFMLFDCIPQLPALAQTLVTVRAWLAAQPANMHIPN
jgi:hypothetical protein